MDTLNRLRAHVFRFIEALFFSIISKVTAFFFTISTTAWKAYERVAMLIFFILAWIHRIALAFRARLRRIAAYVGGFRELPRRLFLLISEYALGREVVVTVFLVLVTITSVVVIVPVMFQKAQLMYSIFTFISHLLFLIIKGLWRVFQIVVAIFKLVMRFVWLMYRFWENLKYVCNTTGSKIATVAYYVVFVLYNRLANVENKIEHFTVIGVGLLITVSIWKRLNLFEVNSGDGVRAQEDTNEGIRQDTPEEPICSDFLLGKCKKGSTCRKHHWASPFHWQYLSGDNWRSFTEEDNEKIEKVYCDEKLDECTVADVKISFESDKFLSLAEMYDVHILPLDNMLVFVQNDFDTGATIRRLSTASYVTDPENTMATQWTWYWEDEYETWRKYDQDQGGGDLQQSLEEAFLSERNGFAFRIANQDYTMNFFPLSDMSQTNVNSGTPRKVRRRPAKFVSRDDVQERRRLRLERKGVSRLIKRFYRRRSHNLEPSKAQQDRETESSHLPAHWSPVPSKTKYKRVPLDPASPEFKEVENLFRKSMNRSVKKISIDRVQNPFMWEKYQRKKDNLSAFGEASANEKRLFHGTEASVVEAICKQNFDWRLHENTLYGKGCYFALNSSYSDCYAREDSNSFKFMFVARVLVGSYAVGQSSYPRPPQKDPWNPASDLYDSCVDNISSPTIFVVFDIDQCYPEYIIKYSHSVY